MQSVTISRQAGQPEASPGQPREASRQPKEGGVHLELERGGNHAGEKESDVRSSTTSDASAFVPTVAVLSLHEARLSSVGRSLAGGRVLKWALERQHLQSLCIELATDTLNLRDQANQLFGLLVGLAWHERLHLAEELVIPIPTLRCEESRTSFGGPRAVCER